jgi:thiol:disulfide interchange protein
MKKIFSLAVVFGIILTSYAQPPHWKVYSEKISSEGYIIHVQFDPGKGWWVYAANDPENEISALRLDCNDSSIRFSGELLSKEKPILIRDSIFKGKKMMVYKDHFSLSQQLTIPGSVPDSLMILISGFRANGKEFLPMDTAIRIALDAGRKKNTGNKIQLAQINLQHPRADCMIKVKTSKGILSLFLLGIGGGLIALLTPCVFPMIPATVSFFTNRSKTKKEGLRYGFFYGFCIFVIYLLASVPFHLIGNLNPEILNSISTNVWVNIIFFTVFLLFALSFFGLFDITLPSNFANTTGARGNAGSLVGIFFMALTLATVSFSCTGPILGTLLVGSLSSNGGAWQLSAGMAGFGLALAMPFALFAMFPNWLKKIPKSGGWLDTVKKVLAFVELALAFKFLSNADLVQHWGILKREVFIGIWIIISTGLILYLFGIFEKRRPVSRGRMVFGMIVVVFTLALIPGLGKGAHANLQWLSGFPPPISYSVYNKDIGSGHELRANAINDYAKALELSRKTGKPILIDFTGWACVNCRKMEEQVWIKPEISELIKNNFILVSLYVDDRKKLPSSEQMNYTTKDGHQKNIESVGDFWATFESENFRQVTQPLYVILSPAGELMNEPVGYTPDINRYRQWLDCGLSASKMSSALR